MSILDALKKQKLREVKAKIVVADSFENAVHKQAEFVQSVLTGEQEAHSEEYKLYHLYRKYREEYSGKEYDLPKVLTTKGLAYWKRVSNKQKEARVSPEHFIKAQFVYFHRLFGKIPKPGMLVTKAAVERAKDFSGDISKKVIATTKEEKRDLASILRAADKQMRDIMKAQKMTRVEIYLKLVIPGHFVFPKEFIESDPDYRKALEIYKNGE